MHQWFECLSTFRYYNWTLAAPLILSLQAFQKNLPKVKLSQVCHIHNSFSANLFSNLCCFTRFWLPRLQRRLGWRRKCKRNQAAGGSGVRGRTVQSSRYASMEKKKLEKHSLKHKHFSIFFPLKSPSQRPSMKLRKSLSWKKKAPLYCKTSCPYSKSPKGLLTTKVNSLNW